ncbi:pyridoxamine 5'-phosphate oxidase family protein [Streptomyces sp. NPDC003860]
MSTEERRVGERRAVHVRTDEHEPRYVYEYERSHGNGHGNEQGRTDEQRALELLGSVSYGRLATSMRAMPFVAPARHVVCNGGVVLRIHRGFGYHRACNGSVVAYGADGFTTDGLPTGGPHAGPDGSPGNGTGRQAPASAMWSVQFIGTAAIVQPTPDEVRRFGRPPLRADGEPFEPVFMRVEPQFVTLHTLDYCEEQPNGHAA